MSDQLAVIFDVDGVLVDSYHAHFQSWQAVAARHGISMSESEFAATFGKTSREIIGVFWGEIEPAEQVDMIDHEKEAAYREIVAADFPAMPGANELVEALRVNGYALAVGSSGPPENVQLALEGLGCKDLFQAAVTGRDVSRGKPDPEVFQLAAERLKVAPKDCAVVEDATHGIKAANAAGMTSIALVSTGHTVDEFAEADHIVHHLPEITPESLRTWIRQRS